MEDHIRILRELELADLERKASAAAATRMEEARDPVAQTETTQSTEATPDATAETPTDAHIIHEWPTTFEPYSGPLRLNSKVMQNIPDCPKARRRAISQISPRLFLSGYLAAEDSNALQAHNIVGVLSVITIKVKIPLICLSVSRGPFANHAWYKIEDSPKEDLLGSLNNMVDWIDERLAATAATATTYEPRQPDGAVLIHCRVGMSRSVAVTTAYIMAKTRRPLTEVVHGLKKQRSVAFPMMNFGRQLELWEKMEYNVWEDKERTQPKALYAGFLRKLQIVKSKETSTDGTGDAVSAAAAAA